MPEFGTELAKASTCTEKGENNKQIWTQSTKHIIILYTVFNKQITHP